MSSQRLCFTAMTMAIAGRWSQVSAITPTHDNGIPVTEACACTPSSAKAIAFIWGSQRVVTMLARTVVPLLRRLTMAWVLDLFPDPYPEFGQCVHKIARHPDRPHRLYMQNHGGWDDRPGIGVLRSDDQGRSWTSIADGLPSDFGFPIVVHPHKPNTIYVVPLEPMRELSRCFTRCVAQRKWR